MPFWLAFLMTKVAAPVVTVIVPTFGFPLFESAAILEPKPPKFPATVSVRLNLIFVPPAETVTCISTSSHLQDWSGNSAIQRNWPREAPLMTRLESPAQLDG